MARLLRRAVAAGIHPAFARKLLEGLAAEAGNFIGMGAPFDTVSSRSRKLPEPLTERERQVLRLLSLGLSSTEVAEQLVISVGTARVHIKRIYRKLDAHGRAEAIEAAERTCLI
jgi:DNA-binding NarL/FixJ family response regulator